MKIQTLAALLAVCAQAIHAAPVEAKPADHGLAAREDHSAEDWNEWYNKKAIKRDEESAEDWNEWYNKKAIKRDEESAEDWNEWYNKKAIKA
ncbi:hypothetical protein UA08_07364 [Talaromyces atroroseus]|uniref:Uncharacterized protein n=1 Tax=Talaromyces atroroseus TaxID=1441469 RepID=A0A225AAM3_TALAT|nr:hypothetical protein UA08_07364 [Talaromyces atroroseus]OKL57210.1 hypothetical protein UA08_07364 [Talaromyces atroroseus]